MTDFGDAAVLLPLAAAMLLWLLVCASRSAIWWVVSVGFCVGLTALLKVFFYGCPPAPDMRSPSGHTAFGMLVYGAIAWAAAMPGRGLRRLMAIGIGAGFVLTIAISRLLLDAHSPPEVGLGLVIGGASLGLFAWNYRRSPAPQVWPLLVAAGLLMTLLHGQELHAEEFLHRITGALGVHCG